MPTFEILRAKAYLQQWGYQPFKPDTNFALSSIFFIQASLENKKSEPKVFDMENIKFWSFLYSKIWKLHNDADGFDMVEFLPNLYINEDGFLIHVEEDNLQAITSFKKVNVFTRPAIVGIDNRTDLGNVVFIVSDAGILYTTYEDCASGIINYETENLQIFDDKFILKPNRALVVKDKVIGEYGNPFTIKAIDILPV